MLSNNTATIAPVASLDKAPVIYPREVRLLALKTRGLSPTNTHTNSGTVPKYLRTTRQRRSLTVFWLFVPLATVAAGSDRLGTIDLPIYNTRKVLPENFDEEVATRLKVHQESRHLLPSGAPVSIVAC